MNLIQRFMVTVFGGFFDKRLWSSTGGSRSTTAKVDVSEDTALNYSAVWCATNLLCGTGASLPLPIFESDDGEKRKKLRKHRAFRLLNISPNSEMPAINFRSLMWKWQVNGGNAYAEIVREGGNHEAPLESLWPIDPCRVTPKRDDSDRLFYEVHNHGRDPTILEPWQMLHLPSIISHDGIVGMGVIQHARETIGAGIAKQTKAAHQLGGGNIPQVVIEHAGKWPDDVRGAFRKEWKEIHGGPEGDTVAVLQGGATAKPLAGFSPQDSQFLESRQFDVEEIARWYNIPPHLLHHLLRATFNNVEEMGINFVTYCLLPWLEIWEQCARMKLFTEEEQDSLFMEHNVDALKRGNAAARAEYYGKMTSAAIMTRNECRRLENLDPVDGGDVYLVQGAMVPLDEDGKPESEFVNPKPAAGDVSSSTTTAPDDEKISIVAGGVKRIITRDLTRMLTKETKAMADYAKKPEQFCDRVDEFYTAHRVMLVDVVTASATALSECGYEIDTGAIAASWVNEGKALMLDAAGAATPDELPEAVQRVIQSKTWSERPEKAIERVQHAVSA